MDSGQQASFQTHDAGVPLPRKELSDKDWEEKKSIIRSLYIEHDLSLARVASRMTQEHGFKAR
jgi:hypothetical protein